MKKQTRRDLLIVGGGAGVAATLGLRPARAELRDIAHQVGWQHPALLQPASRRRSCCYDHRIAVVASGRMDVEPVTATDGVNRAP